MWTPSTVRKPNCHKPSFEAGIISLAQEAARAFAHESAALAG